MKKVLAGVSAAAIMLTQVSSVIAAYSDVSAGVWFEEAVSAFTDAGYLDATQPNFRPNDTANRAEFTKLIVELNGGILSTPPAVPSFTDVSASAWYYGYMEEAGKEGWVKGDGNCYGSQPCYARPASNISRAEASALIVRAFGLESTGEAATFVDNPSGQWYTEAIQIAADHCVLQGDSTTGRVRPADNMNRAEMVVMLNRVDQGLTYGVDCGTDTPSSEPAITGAQAVSTVKVDVDFNVVLDETVAETVANWAISPALSISSATLVSDKTVELVVASAMEANKEYTVTASNLKDTDGTVFSDSATFNGYSTLPQGNGTLEVSVASKNPVGDTVPKGAHTVTMLSLDLTASCDDSVTLETLTVLHEGFGAKTDIDSIYATIDGGRVSRERSIDSSDQTAEVRFTSALVIPACKTVTVDIVADIAAAADTGAEHNLAVELASDFASNAKSVTGNFPLRGNTFKVAAVTSGAVTVTYRSVTPSQLEVGDKDVVIGKFEVASSSTEDQTLYSMTLHQAGTVSDGDVTNIRIRRSDKTVLTNTVAQFKSKYATVTFNPPFTVLEGDKVTLEVVADVVGGAAKTVSTDFDETSDIFAVGSLYGYGINGQLYGSTVSTAGTVASITLDAGQFTVEINGPSQQTYTRDQADAVLANIVLSTGGETVNVKKLYVAIQGNNVTGATLNTVANSTTYDGISEQLENVTLRNATTGRSLEAVRLTTAGTSGHKVGTATGTFQIYRFDDFTVNGKENWQLKVDMIDNGSTYSPHDGDQYKVHICGEPTHVSSGGSSVANATGCAFGGMITAVTTYNMEVEGLSTSDKVLDVRPRGVITGNAQRIADAGLTVTVKALTPTETAVKNAKNVRLMRFEARAGEAKSILLTKAVFTAMGGATSLQNGTNFALWVDSDDDGTVDTILDSGKAAVSGTVSFSNITNGGYVIGKEGTKVFEVHSDIAGSLSTTSLQLAFATGSTTLNSYIEAETVDRGTSLSNIKTNGAYSEAGITSADIVVTTTDDTTIYTLVAQGSLFVTKHETLRNRQLLAGELGEPVLSLNMRAVYEPVEVTKLQLTSSGSTAASVDRLELWKRGATAPFASASTNNCGSDDVPGFNPGRAADAASITTFCVSMQNQQLVVPKNDEVVILVKPRLKNDEAGAASNQVIAVWVDKNAAMNNSTGTGAVRARGVDSSNNLNGNDADNDGEVVIGASTVGGTNAYIAGARNVSVLSKIESIVNANPDANGTNVSAGVKEIAQFKISALANSNAKQGTNKATLSGVIFNVTSTNVGITDDTWTFYNKANPSTTASCTSKNAAGTAFANENSGSFVVVCDLQSTAMDAKVDAGSNETFVLRAEINTPDIVAANTSNLLVSLQNFNDMAKTTFGPASTASHFSWIDWEEEDTTPEYFKWIESSESVVNSTSYSG